MNKLVLDVETGGYDTSINSICEIGLLVIDKNMNIILEHETLIQPYLKEGLKFEDCYKPEAMSVNGITKKELTEGGISIEKAIGEFAITCLRYNCISVIGHNVKFDLRFMQSALVEYGYQFQFEPICTIQKSKKFLDLDSYSLKSVCDYFQIENKEEHRALSDAKAALEVYKRLKLY